ncbi:MAG: integrase, partial [Chloroflexi bacterium]
ATGPLSANSVRAYVRVWKAFFNWCYQEELIEVDVVTRLRSPEPVKKIIPAFTVEHIQKMLDTCDTSTDLGFRNYVILLLFLDTGMRLSELAGLNVGDVHEQFVKVLGKGRKEREIGIRPEVGKLLWKYIHKYRKPTNSSEVALFVSDRGRRMNIGTVKEVLRSVKKKSGIDDVRVSAHTFRHTFAKWYLKRGGELFKLSRELGHSSIKITEVYLKDFGSTEAREDHNAFSPIGLLDLGKRRRKKKDVSE